MEGMYNQVVNKQYENGNMTKDSNRNISITFVAPQHEKRTRPLYPAFGWQKISKIEYNSLNLRSETLKIGGGSDMKAKTSYFALHFSHLALSLPSHITINGDGMKTHIHNTYDAMGNKLGTTAGEEAEQQNHYYPSGILMASSTGGTIQPYKYGGKELLREAGLDQYDFGARWMDPVVGPRFTTMDPMCEKYYDIWQTRVK